MDKREEKGNKEAEYKEAIRSSNREERKAKSRQSIKKLEGRATKKP